MLITCINCLFIILAFSVLSFCWVCTAKFCKKCTSIFNVLLMSRLIHVSINQCARMVWITAQNKQMHAIILNSDKPKCRAGVRNKKDTRLLRLGFSEHKTHLLLQSPQRQILWLQLLLAHFQILTQDLNILMKYKLFVNRSNNSHAQNTRNKSTNLLSRLRTDRQTETDRQTDRQTDTHTHTVRNDSHSTRTEPHIFCLSQLGLKKKHQLIVACDLDASCNETKLLHESSTRITVVRVTNRTLSFNAGSPQCLASAGWTRLNIFRKHTRTVNDRTRSVSLLPS